MIDIQKFAIRGIPCHRPRIHSERGRNGGNVEKPPSERLRDVSWQRCRGQACWWVFGFFLLYEEMKALKSLCCPFGEEDPLVFFNISVYIPIILYLYKHSYIYIYSSRKAAWNTTLVGPRAFATHHKKIMAWLNDAVSNCKLFLTILGTSFHGMGLWQKLVSSCQSLRSGRSSWIMVSDTIDFASKFLCQNTTL